MSDTVGSLIDKLFTVDSKMWCNQELLHEIRRQNFEWFKNRFLRDDDSNQELYNMLLKVCDLNLQRQLLITEIDNRIVETVEAGLRGEDLHNPNFIINSHKTY